ncbi:transposase [Aneurinibacillus sp. BA2021]|nr:transposase [Aneurinibacillus sp. BA2021]
MDFPVSSGNQELGQFNKMNFHMIRWSIPLFFIKMIFMSYLYGIRSERQLEKETQINIVYR